MDEKTKLAIFDFDGTLFDTRMVNFAAYSEALKEYGYSIEYDYYCTSCNGLHYKDFLPGIMGNNLEAIESVHEKKMIYYQKHLDKARINGHLFAIAEALRNLYYTAVVTTASRKNCLDLLLYFNRENDFDLILAHEDITRSKPDPEGFMKAIDYFGVDKKDTIIFEDSVPGIEAAQKTGAAVFVVERF
ncbi:haloacid dehalogenase [Spirochaetia bacterium]|nr:haloacid dehalogenase [Spirochaetia bacterium]